MLLISLITAGLVPFKEELIASDFRNKLTGCYFFEGDEAEQFILEAKQNNWLAPLDIHLIWDLELEKGSTFSFQLYDTEVFEGMQIDVRYL